MNGKIGTINRRINTETTIKSYLNTKSRKPRISEPYSDYSKKKTNVTNKTTASMRPRQPSVPRYSRPVDKKTVDQKPPEQTKTEKTRSSAFKQSPSSINSKIPVYKKRQQTQTTTKPKPVNNNSVGTSNTLSNNPTQDRPPSSGRPSSLSPRPSATGTTISSPGSSLSSKSISKQTEEVTTPSTSITNRTNTFSNSYLNTASIHTSSLSPRSPRLSSSSNIPKPVGLNNLGNTCFFNAAVQCLARVMPLTNFILSTNFESQLNPNNPKSSKGRIAHAYRSFLQDMSKGSSYGARDPTDLRRAIIGKFKRFANYGQHDSQELLCSLLDGLHEDMNQSHYAHGREPSPDSSIQKNSEDSWSLHKIRNISPIVDIFHGVLYSSISCPECLNVEAVHDPFMFLSLDIPRRFSTVKLSDCLNSFSQCETLDAKNKWKCEKCGKMVCATKEMGVDKCAKILIVHLKRFSGEGYFASKIDTSVEYPDFLESSSFAKHDSGRFRLIGAVFHSGGLGGGHYTSAAVDPASGDWYSFNDSLASKIDVKSAHKGSAYILFYQRE